jgi:transposase
VSNDRFAALDVHARTTTFVVLDGKGKVVMEGVVDTTGEALLSLVKGMSGAVQLTFEEGTHAAWLYELLRPHAAKLVVCNPRKNVRQSESKSDRVDAHQLARWLRSGDLSPVYHGDDGTRVLKELVRGYEHVVDDSTRARNRLKAIYRSRGVWTPGRGVYRSEERESWLSQLDSAGLRSRAEWLYAQIGLLDALGDAARGAVERESRKHRGCRLLQTVPGIGWLRAATVVAHVSTPFRFRTKRQFWSYCGFAVVTVSSSDWEMEGSQLVRRQQPVATRGLNRKHNRHLKDAFKGAATTACSDGGAFRPHFDHLVASGMREPMARLNVARKIAATSLTMWKKGEKFDLDRAVIRGQ